MSYSKYKLWSNLTTYLPNVSISYTMSLEDELRRQQQQIEAEAKLRRDGIQNAKDEADRKFQESNLRQVSESHARIADENKRLREILSKSGIEPMVQEIVTYANANNFYRGHRVNFKETTEQPSIWGSLKGEKPRTFFSNVTDIEEGDVLEPAQLQITQSEGQAKKDLTWLETSPFWRADVSWLVAGPMRDEHVSDGGQGSAGTSYRYRSREHEGFAVKVSPYGIQIGGMPYAKEIVGAEFHGFSNPKALEGALISALTGKPLS